MTGLRPAQAHIEPRVLSFDIETDAKGQRLLAISLYGAGCRRGADRRWQRACRCRRTRICDAPTSMRRSTLSANASAANRSGRTDRLEHVDFDSPCSRRIATRVRHPFDLGRDPGAHADPQARRLFRQRQASIPGRLVLDGIDLLRGAFVRMEDYSLDAVAREVLAKARRWRASARIASARSCTTIATICRRLRSMRAPMRGSHTRSSKAQSRAARVRAQPARRHDAGSRRGEHRLVRLPVSDRARATAHRRADRAVRDDARVFAAQQGGHVLEPVAGLHRNVWVFDFKSLYPSIIRTFNIDPLAYVDESRCRATT